MEKLSRQNEVFAHTRFSADLKIMPSLKTLIIGCVDSRVDPVDIFGLEPGEAAVIRNVGGRVTQNVIQTMGILRAVSQANGGETGPGWNLVVLHHTDCGIKCLSHAQEQLANYLAVDAAALDGLAINDPHAAVAIDVAALKAHPKLPGGFLVTGLVYDVATGKVETVVPSALLRE